MPKENTQNKDITSWIIGGWMLVVLSFFSKYLGPSIAIVVSIAILGVSIYLITFKNQRAKINGWIILTLWIVTFLISFVGEF